MKKGIIYIAGPMRGYRALNFKEFYRAQIMLEEANWRVMNPAEEDVADLIGESVRTGAPIISNSRKFMVRDMKMVARSDAIYMLDGWEESDGARAEFYAAKLAGLKIIYQTSPQKKPERKMVGFKMIDSYVGFTKGKTYTFKENTYVIDDEGTVRASIDPSFVRIKKGIMEPVYE